MKNLGAVDSLPAYLTATEGVHYRGREESRFFCRGQAFDGWRLRPKIGRYAYTGGDVSSGRASAQWRVAFDSMMAVFEREYVAHHRVELPRRIDRLTLAQHYGLATPLLDWSLNPLVALYFACLEPSSMDGIVFFYSPHPGDRGMQSDSDLDSNSEIQTLRPRRFDQRMVNQDAVLTYHSNPVTDAGDQLGDHCSAIRVRRSAKRLILRELRSIGMRRAFLFPGLASACSEIDAQYRSEYTIEEDRSFWRHATDFDFSERFSDERVPYLDDEAVDGGAS